MPHIVTLALILLCFFAAPVGAVELQLYDDFDTGALDMNKWRVRTQKLDLAEISIDSNGRLKLYHNAGEDTYDNRIRLHMQQLPDNTVGAMATFYVSRASGTRPNLRLQNYLVLANGNYLSFTINLDATAGTVNVAYTIHGSAPEETVIESQSAVLGSGLGTGTAFKMGLFYDDEADTVVFAYRPLDAAWTFTSFQTGGFHVDSQHYLGIRTSYQGEMTVLVDDVYCVTN